MNELKPCPFCGGKADFVYFNNGSRYRSNVIYKNDKCTVKCLKCEVELPRAYKGTNRAAEAWNRRANDQT